MPCARLPQKPCRGDTEDIDPRPRLGNGYRSALFPSSKRTGVAKARRPPDTIVRCMHDRLSLFLQPICSQNLSYWLQSEIPFCPCVRRPRCTPIVLVDKIRCEFVNITIPPRDRLAGGRAIRVRTGCRSRSPFTRHRPAPPAGAATAAVGSRLARHAWYFGAAKRCQPRARRALPPVLTDIWC